MAIVVDVVAGTPTTGLWCPQCLLLSGVALWLYLLTADGPRRTTQVRKCFDCGSPIPGGESQ